MLSAPLVKQSSRTSTPRTPGSARHTGHFKPPLVPILLAVFTVGILLMAVSYFVLPAHNFHISFHRAIPGFHAPKAEGAAGAGGLHPLDVGGIVPLDWNSDVRRHLRDKAVREAAAAAAAAAQAGSAGLGQAAEEVGAAAGEAAGEAGG